MATLILLFQLLPEALRGRNSDPLFVEVPASSSGIVWVHENAKSEKHYLPETMGPGLSFLDYDGDGWLDLYLLNSGPCDFFQPGQALKNALYRNNGDGTFEDVTERAGVQGGTFAMGVAAADFDNDGDTDLFVTAYGRTLLYQNRGDGSFDNVTDRAGVGLSGWTTSAAWFDYDNDGWLDLFVCNFVEFGVDQHISCGLNPLGKAYYCVPRVFKPTASSLFRNNRNGTFTEVGHSTAIGQALGKALGVVAVDINEDGRMDLFVANDTVQDFLFLNRGDNRWEEIGIYAGVGFSVDGEVQSGMGVEAADFDEDGWQDLFVANIDHQNFSLFKNNGDETFTDVGVVQGIARATYLMSGWGVRFFDFDNDGDLDLFMANGHPDDMIAEYASTVTYQQPLLLFENREGQLSDISLEAGPVFRRVFSSRGLTVGDYDNDGRVDVAVINNGQPPLLLRNHTSKNHHWLGVELEGTTASRDAIGAKITWSVQGKKRSRVLNGGGSYLSSHDLRQVLGLGSATRLDWLEVRWPLPSRRMERFEVPAIDGYVTLREGEGKAVTPSGSE